MWHLRRLWDQAEMTPEQQKRTLWVDTETCPEDWVEILRSAEFICQSFFPMLGLQVIQLEGVDPATIPDPLPAWIARTQ